MFWQPKKVQRSDLKVFCRAIKLGLEYWKSYNSRRARTCTFIPYECHPGVWHHFMMVSAVKQLLMIRPNSFLVLS